MKVGPVTLPFNDAMGALGFIVCVVAAVLLARMAPIPARFKP